MSQKILLIDWNRIVKSNKFVRFPVNISLAIELFGSSAGEWNNKEFQDKYEDKLNIIFKNMIRSGIEFFAPGGSELRRLLTMLWWFYIKKSNFPECSSKDFTEYYEKYDKTYNLDPELFEYLYDEYYQFFKENYEFEVNDDVQRLIDRKPDDWGLGIFSDDRTKDELGIILDELNSSGDYGKIFNFRFGASSPIVEYSDEPDVKDIVFSDESVAKAINQFNKKDSNVFLLYESSTPREYLKPEIQHILFSEDDLIDRFDFDNPGVLMEADNSYKVEEEPKEESESEQLEEDNPDARWCNLQKASVSYLSWSIGQDASYWHNYKITHDIPEGETLLSYAYPPDVVKRYKEWQKENEKNSTDYGSEYSTVKKYKELPFLEKFIANRFPITVKIKGVGEMIVGYSLILSAVVGILVWILGLFDVINHKDYEYIITMLFTPAAIGIVIYISTLALLIPASVPVELINSYYRKKNLGLSTHEAIVNILKLTIMWILIIVIGYYIVGSR